MEKVIIFGTGSIAQIAHLYLTEDINYEVVAFTVSKDYIEKNTFLNLPIVAFENIDDIYSIKDYKMFIPLSYKEVNKLREEKFKEAKQKGYDFITFIHTKSIIASNVKIGKNCFILEGTIIQPFVTISDNCIIWSGSHIGHHSTIKKNCFIAPKVAISGHCKIGKNSFIGINATIRDNIKIGKSNVIGAGALILNNTENNKVFKSIKTKALNILSKNLNKI